MPSTPAYYFCPSCQDNRPASEFLGGRQDPGGNLALGVRCVLCIDADREARETYSRLRRASRTRPALVEAVTANRHARAVVQGRCVAYSDALAARPLAMAA